MRILAISGSPRRGGNTDTAAKRALEMLAGLGKTKFLRVHDHHIKHCLGCRRCMEIMRCAIQDDDFEGVLAEWQSADVLIVAAPVYWLGPPGALKDFIDRSHGLYAHQVRPFAGKKAAIVSVATASGFETHERMLSTWLGHYGADIVGEVRLLAREKDDLAGHPAELRKLSDFIEGIKARLA